MKRTLSMNVCVLASMLLIAGVSVSAQTLDGHQKNQHHYELSEGAAGFTVSATCNTRDCLNLKLSVNDAQQRLLKFEKVDCAVYELTDEDEYGNELRVGNEYRCQAKITVPIPAAAVYSAVVENLGGSAISYRIAVVREPVPCKGFAGDWIYVQGTELSITVRGNKAQGSYKLMDMPATFSGTITGNVLEGSYLEPNYPKVNETRTGRLRMILADGVWKYTFWKPDGTEGYTYTGRCAYDVQNNPSNEDLSRETLRLMGMGGRSIQTIPEIPAPANGVANNRVTGGTPKSTEVRDVPRPTSRNSGSNSPHVAGGNSIGNNPTSGRSESKPPSFDMSKTEKALADLEMYLKTASTSTSLNEIRKFGGGAKVSMNAALNAASDGDVKESLRSAYDAISALGDLRLYYENKTYSQDPKMVKSFNEIVVGYGLAKLPKDGRVRKVGSIARLSLSLVQLKINAIEQAEDDAFFGEMEDDTPVTGSAGNRTGGAPPSKPGYIPGEGTKPKRAYPTATAAPPAVPRPPTVEELLGGAETAFKYGRYDSVISNCLEVLKNNPEQPRGNLLLGQAYYQMREYEKSLPYLTKAVALGESVFFPIAHHRKVFAGRSDNGTDNDLNVGEIIFQKGKVELRFKSNTTKTGVQVSDESFNVPLSALYELKYEPNKEGKLKLEVGIPGAAGGKEKRRTYNFYPDDAKVENVRARLTSLSDTEIRCVSCTPTTKMVYDLLLSLRK